MEYTKPTCCPYHNATVEAGMEVMGCCDSIGITSISMYNCCPYHQYSRTRNGPCRFFASADAVTSTETTNDVTSIDISSIPDCCPYHQYSRTRNGPCRSFASADAVTSTEIANDVISTDAVNNQPTSQPVSNISQVLRTICKNLVAVSSNPDYTECSICMEEHIHPHIRNLLDCGHNTICTACIEKMLPDTGLLKCPLCQQETTEVSGRKYYP